MACSCWSSCVKLLILTIWNALEHQAQTSCLWHFSHSVTPPSKVASGHVLCMFVYSMCSKQGVVPLNSHLEKNKGCSFFVFSFCTLKSVIANSAMMCVKQRSHWDPLREGWGHNPQWAPATPRCQWFFSSVAAFTTVNQRTEFRASTIGKEHKPVFLGFLRLLPFKWYFMNQLFLWHAEQWPCTHILCQLFGCLILLLVSILGCPVVLSTVLNMEDIFVAA